MAVTQIEIQGLKEAQAKTEQVVQDLRGPPFVQGMRDATLIVQRQAKINAPVDTGRLRASITPKVEQHGSKVQGIVGSNVVYAPFQELGWTTRGGVKIPGRRYLQRALEDNAKRIFDLIGKAVSRIVVK